MPTYDTIDKARSHSLAEWILAVGRLRWWWTQLLRMKVLRDFTVVSEPMANPLAYGAREPQHIVNIASIRAEQVAD